MRSLPAIKLLPTAVGDWLADALGVNEGMDGFTGREPADERQQRARHA